MYISTPEVKALVNRAFPNFNGRRIQVQPFPASGGMRCESYWSGGQRDYYAIIPLSDAYVGAAFMIPENGTPFVPEVKPLTELPVGFALVCHTAGHHESVTVYVNQANLVNMLPAPVELSEHERQVLKYTSSFKSSYAGIGNYRFHTANRDNPSFTLENWETAKASCILRGFLNKAGAITESGRNAIAR